MKGGVVFLETSALLRILFGEEGADEAGRRIAAAGRIVASRLLRLEAERAVLRASSEDRLSEREVVEVERELRGTWPHVEMWEITEEVCDLAARIAPRSRLRSLDAIHLATFHQLKQRSPEAMLLSFDSRLREAAGAPAR